jgi:NitT/TauT family transport system substrate-binding protein
MTMSRLLPLLLALASPAWGDPADTAPFRIVVTEETTPLVPNSVVELAGSLGYFAREGVDVRIVRAAQTPMAVAAMINGGGDMANVSVEAAVTLAARSQTNFKAVVSPNTQFRYMIVGRDAVRAAEELRGKRFGVGRIGSLDHALSTDVLRARGVEATSLDFVSLGPPDARLRALAAGRIAATTVSIGTWATFPAKAGLHVLVSQQEFAAIAPVVGKVNIVRADVLESRREAVLAVVAALIRASRDFAANPVLWVDAMSRARPDVSRADLERLAEQFKDDWSVNGGMNRNDLARTADWVYRVPESGELPRVPLGSWADFSVVDAVLAKLGTDPGGDAPDR